MCGVSLKTPVLAASGTFAYGVEFREHVDLAALGGVIVKGLSREPMDGNPPPRLFETQSGMLNSIGLQNIGVRAFVRDKLPELRDLGAAVFANIFGYAVEDYVEVARVLEDSEGLAGYELNVSCPNTRHGGMYFSSDPVLLGEVVSAADAGADAISLINTFVALAIDPRTRRPRLGAGAGGLSGPAIKPIALRMVYEAARAVAIPVIGLGGIATGTDAAEFLIAGATAVQVGTANFFDPRAPERVAEELDRFLKQEGIARAADLVGTLKL